MGLEVRRLGIIEAVLHKDRHRLGGMIGRKYQHHHAHPALLAAKTNLHILARGLAAHKLRIRLPDLKLHLDGAMRLRHASIDKIAEQSQDLRTSEIHWSEDSPEGKLDLLINIDFRVAGTGLYSDLVLPAATWYEKYDISSTDMHPFVHPFNPAIAPPWEARSDWDFFKKL